MDVEQHPARCDGDCDPDGDAREHAAGDVSPPAAEQERSTRIERRCCSRMAARKRGTERGRRRVERGSRAVSEDLDCIHEDLLAREQHEQERDDPCASCANRLHHGEQDGEDKHHPGDRAQLRDEIEPVRREGRRVGVPPCGDASVGAVQVGVRALEVGKRAEPEAAYDRQEQRQR